MPENIELPNSFEFHHVGLATTSIKREIDIFALMGYRQEGSTFTDPIQGVTGCFLVGPGPRIELLESFDGSETLTPWISAGVKIYHFGYMVLDIEAAIKWATECRARVVVLAVPAVAFGMRRISFVMFRNGMLIELIERPGISG